ncbi:phosphate transport system protein [Sedimentibacter acidaminivorans]|jgi:phosphate transport system protein|uniref:Phosphate-specific transport system accessory protein PhoU n=1 Tax=Sedimentibacter acidaminivorans TaxID=913099 RepID=A0ABS4GA60_9FIRM|nr:phosphate signaling complex protein PhoU [Sedimentibacter acidaminivorans]MBP1924561.1 phosphate transport system protein [Sedimentibacter acidaminivorans]
MRGRFDKELENLNLELIKMGGLIENSIETTVKALINQDLSLVKKVNEYEVEIDEMEKTIESHCLKLLLQQQPVASDLRLISTALKMITDMERIGDNAEDIAEISQYMVNQKFIKNLVHIPQMAEATIGMVRKSIDAFVNKDKELALEVCASDDIVDNLFTIIKNELIEKIQEDKNNGEQAIDLLMIAKYFERIGDHAENIAEWVIFSITGEHKYQ